MPKNITLRMARAADISPLWGLLSAYFKMNPGWPEPDENATIAWGLTIIIKGGCILACHGNKLIGSVGVEKGAFQWNPAVGYLNGVWFYVAPEFRKGGTPNQLIKAVKDIAIANKMALRLDNIWGVEPELQDRWRATHGFRYLGGNYGWFPPPSDGAKDGL